MKGHFPIFHQKARISKGTKELIKTYVRLFINSPADGTDIVYVNRYNIHLGNPFFPLVLIGQAFQIHDRHSASTPMAVDLP